MLIVLFRPIEFMSHSPNLFNAVLTDSMRFDGDDLFLDTLSFLKHFLVLLWIGRSNDIQNVVLSKLTCVE